MSYRDLLKNKTQALESIANKFKAPQEFEEDNRFWYPNVDKAGNGLAVIRFLPAHENEDSPVVHYYRRSFQGPTGKWYIENCPTSLKKDAPDPVYEEQQRILGGKDWKIVSEAVKTKWRALKRKETFITNIYVEKDPANPENEGKVFLFRFGKFIREMIAEKMNPKYEGEERINPFDMVEGCSLKLKISNDDGWRSYKKSEWMPVGPLIKKGKTNEPDHDKQEAIYNQVYPLAPFIAPDQFKSYEELERKLNEVLGKGRNARPVATSEEAAVDTLEEEATEVKDETSDSEIDQLFADLEDA